MSTITNSNRKRIEKNFLFLYISTRIKRFIGKKVITHCFFCHFRNYYCIYHITYINKSAKPPEGHLDSCRKKQAFQAFNLNYYTYIQSHKPAVFCDKQRKIKHMRPVFSFFKIKIKKVFLFYSEYFLRDEI